MSLTGTPCCSLLTRFLYLTLENPEVVKDKELRQDVFDLLGALVQKYNHALGACTTIVHMLPHFEHLAEPFADMLKLFADAYATPRVAQDVLR